jgi:HK97 family phage major capsid protein
MTVIEMRRKRANLWEQMKEIHERAKTENRDMNAEEKQRWEALNAEVDSLKATIDREERHAELEAEMVAESSRQAEQDGEQEARHEQTITATAEYRDAYRAYLRGGMSDLDREQRTLLRQGHQALEGAEARALGVAAGPVGGFTVPDEAMRPIVSAMLAVGGVRRTRASVITTASGADLPIPLSDDTANEGERIGENAGVAELDPTFGQKILRSYMYTSRIVRVPYQFLQDTSISDFESWLAEMFGQRIGRRQNRDFTNGAGGNQPEGLVSASTLGAQTAAAGVIAWEDLVALEHSVDPSYRLGAQWMFHDAVLQELKQLSDGQNRPLWLPGVSVGEPDTILRYSYVINQHMPAPVGGAWSTGDRAIVFGDMSYYWIRDVRGFSIIRLDERYADNLQVGFLAFARADGALIDAGTHPIRHLAIQ